MGIDSSYYEAAVVDGASRWQRIRYITLPALAPTDVYKRQIYEEEEKKETKADQIRQPDFRTWETLLVRVMGKTGENSNPWYAALYPLARALGIGYNPVSYTHLDVYKRQGTEAAGMKESAESSTAQSTDVSDLSGPVSYTHLDVYKRQSVCYDRCPEVYADAGNDIDSVRIFKGGFKGS